MITEQLVVGSIAQMILNFDGIVTPAMMREHVRTNYVLSESDMLPAGAGSAYKHRYHSRINDLTSNSTLCKFDMRIVRVSGGHTTRTYATRHNIPEMVRGQVNTPRTRRVVTPPLKLNRGDVLNSVVTYYKLNKANLLDSVRSQRDHIVEQVIELMTGPDDMLDAVELVMDEYSI